MNAIIKAEKMGFSISENLLEKMIIQPSTFKVFPGDFIGIYGPSGSGKTTLLHLMSMMVSPNHGKISVYSEQGHLINQSDRDLWYREQVGFIFQHHSLFSTLNVYENVAISLRLKGIPKDLLNDKVMSVLSKVGLADKAYSKVAYLSGGERQRVSFCRAFAKKPHIIFADEPTAHLDQQSSSQMIDLLQSLMDDSQIIMMTSHDHGIIEAFKNIWRLADGKLMK
jgi:putative ABC transport system ATP-binding protein